MPPGGEIYKAQEETSTYRFSIKWRRRKADGLDMTVVNLSARHLGGPFNRQSMVRTLLAPAPNTHLCDTKKHQNAANVERRPHPIVSQIDALDTIAFRARTTAPDLSLTPTAFPPSTTISCTCDFSSTLPPSFSMPLTYANEGAYKTGANPQEQTCVIPTVSN